jgi:hypothetical protein
MACEPALIRPVVALTMSPAKMFVPPTLIPQPWGPFARTWPLFVRLPVKLPPVRLTAVLDVPPTVITAPVLLSMPPAIVPAD